MATFKHILVPTDFSPAARHAVEMAIDLARRSGAALTLLHATEIPSYAYHGVMTAAPVDLLKPVHDAAMGALSEALAEVRAQLPGATSMLRSGSAVDEIIAAVRETHADLVVIGTHGRKGLSHLLLGSVAERVVRASPVPVLTVRGDAAPPPVAPATSTA